MKCVDLFSGCGGMSLGFQNAGFDVTLAMDNWEGAVKVYNTNFAHEAILQNILNTQDVVDILRNFKFDIIVGGPPCQDFSSAGKRDETLGRATLTYKFCDVVRSTKPRFFVMENVERIKRSQAFSDIIRSFSSAGYGLSSVILDASYCGVPQARRRLFLIGELDGSHNTLESVYQSRLSNTPMTVRDYLPDIDLDYYYRHPRNYARRGVYSVNEPSPTIRGVNRPIPPGYRKHKSDPVDVNEARVRPLTTKERARIQTFPEDFVFLGPKTHQEQMIGNSVPVRLAEFVAEGIIILKGEQEHPLPAKVQLELFPKGTRRFAPSMHVLKPLGFDLEC